LRILLTNAFLDRYTGTEVVVRDLALEFQRQGHEPVVYSPRLGAVAQQLRAAGIRVTDNLHAIPNVPDIIHGQHHAPVMKALAHFPDTPAIYVCHDATSPLDEPLLFPRILQHVAVDMRCRRRLETNSAIPRDRITIIENAVDLLRFLPRAPLPDVPRTALIFSNARRQFRAIEQACRQHGLTLHALGRGSRNDIPNHESVLPEYDIVFAKARCALEALCVGAAVVLCDVAGAGPLVNISNMAELRRMNFGRGVLLNPLTPSFLAGEIAKYNPQDSAEVGRWLRAEAGLNRAAHRYVELYSNVIATHQALAPDPEAERCAFRKYSEWNRTDPEQIRVRRMEKIGTIPVVGKTVVTLVASLRAKRTVS